MSHETNTGYNPYQPAPEGYFMGDPQANTPPQRPFGSPGFRSPDVQDAVLVDPEDQTPYTETVPDLGLDPRDETSYADSQVGKDLAVYTGQQPDELNADVEEVEVDPSTVVNLKHDLDAQLVADTAGLARTSIKDGTETLVSAGALDRAITAEAARRADPSAAWTPPTAAQLRAEPQPPTTVNGPDRSAPSKIHDSTHAGQPRIAR